MAGRLRRRRSAVTVALALLAAGCSSAQTASDERDPAGSPPVATGATTATTSDTEPPATSSDDETDGSSTTDAPAPAGPAGTTGVTSTSDTTTSDPSTPVGAGTDCPPIAADGDAGVEEVVEVVEVGEFDAVGDIAGGTVYAAAYPLPDGEGNPWSQWGQGVVLPDGRFVSGVGDHLGEDGRSWFYEYDPATGELARTAEVGPAIGHEAGDWGYGKIHAPMALDMCDRVITTTYWGTRRGLTFGGSYSGDHVIRYDPATRTVESLGVPVEGHGIPSLGMSPDRTRLYIEAVDPESEPDAGVFAVISPDTGEVLAVDDSDEHIGFRDILVTGDGTAMYATDDAGMAGMTADGDPIEEPGVLGDGWLRATSDPATDGTVAVVTRGPGALHRRAPDGSMDEVLDLDEYVASITLAPDGRTAYYVPGAHGDGYELGAPLIATDLDTGDTTEIVRLNELVEPELGIGLGGTFNVVADPTGDRVFIGFNGSEDVPDDKFGEVVLVVIEFDPR